MSFHIIPLSVFFINAFFLNLSYHSVEAQMWTIGPINGKTFFADNTARNFSEALSHCQTQNMQLARIDSHEEFQFLNSHYDSEQFSGWYWTAARDRHTYKQFAWADSNSEIDEVSFGSHRFIIRLDPASCLTFSSLQGTSKGLIVPCEATGGHTLCQN